MILVTHELKQTFKSLMIWSLSVGFICWGCIILYKSVEGSLSNVADMYANMGEMTKALGLDKVSLATLDGYFATEIALMFGLGAGLFASMLGAGSLSKEEEGHTSEFLYTLPHSRTRIIFGKYLSLLIALLCFNLICVGFELLAIWQMKMDFSYDHFVGYHLLAFLMQVELMTIGFLISSLSHRKQMGAALGLTLLLYAMDLMVRIVPDLDKLKYLTPYYYASGADVFSKTDLDWSLVGTAILVILLSLVAAFAIMRRRDIQA
ncbi:ABC transporter permease subunit [Streptococcus rifensis]